MAASASEIRASTVGLVMVVEGQIGPAPALLSRPCA
jgi:hypothetical protein